MLEDRVCTVLSMFDKDRRILHTIMVDDVVDLDVLEFRRL